MAMKVLGIVGLAQSQQDQQCYQEEKMLSVFEKLTRKIGWMVRHVGSQ